jgi:hypothetical protein
MPLAAPPAVAVLAALATRRTAGLALHRVYRADRAQPWFFAGIAEGADPLAQGRFDLPLPDGACYTATTAVAAVLETFQHLVGSTKPVTTRPTATRRAGRPRLTPCTTTRR